MQLNELQLQCSSLSPDFTQKLLQRPNKQEQKPEKKIVKLRKISNSFTYTALSHKSEANNFNEEADGGKFSESER